MPSSLRSRLITLLLGTTLPLVVLAVADAWQTYLAERQRMDDATKAIARGVALGVAREVQRGLAGISALSLSRPLCAGDLDAFRDQLHAFVQHQHPGANAVLADRHGRQLVNLLAPPDGPLPQRRELRWHRESITTGQPAVSDVYAGTFRERVITLEVPVTCGGDIRYTLALVPRLESYGSALAQQHLPPGWTILLLDRRGHPIATSRHHPENFELELDSEWPSVATDFAATGSGGRDTVLAESPVAEFGWRVVIGRPAHDLLAALAHSMSFLLVSALVLVGVGTGLAVVVARTIVRPMERLGELAVQQPFAETESLPASGLHEIDLVAGRLQDALRELHLADRRKDQFVSTVAHELRNPLSPLMNVVQLLERRESPAPEDARLLAVARRQLAQMQRLVQDLLDIGRSGQGKLVLAFTDLDLRDAAQAGVESVLERMAVRRQVLELRLPSEPVPVRGDAIRLTQMLTNLLDNAAKYSPDGSTVSMEVRSEKDSATVRITDQGSGLDPEQLSHVFDLYWQAASGHASSGLGIGLALVRRLVELHGGTVEADSPGPGRGCTFTLRLPRPATTSARTQR